MTGRFPRALVVSCVLVVLSLWCVRAMARPARRAPPVRGKAVPELAILDEVMLELMAENDISAGMLAVSRKGKVVFHRAYGWKDERRKVPLDTDAVMRIASVTKPITAAAVRHLVAKQKIRLDDRVFQLGSRRKGLLDLEPFGTPDPRLVDITVAHLLAHQGGWDRDEVGDPTYREEEIAKALDVPSPPSREDTVRWIMGQPLQFDPGSKDEYANIGYLVLGLIIEEVSGVPLETYVQRHVFKPLGVDAKAVFLGRTFEKDRDKREPWYDAAGRRSDNVFYPAKSRDRRVPSPYGGWHHEARVGQGGLVASPLAILAFLEAHSVSGRSIGGPRRRPGGWRLTHTGSLRGTTALARQRGDGIDYVALFNKRTSEGESYSNRLKKRIDEILDSDRIERWPD